MNSTATVLPDIADGIKEYSAGLTQYMGLELMPPLPVQRKSADFHKIAVAQATQATGSLVRAPGASYAQIQHTTTTDSYACVEYGLEEPIDDGDALELAPNFDAEMAAAELNARHLREAQETRIATLLFNASTFSGFTSDVGTEWSDSGGTPVADVRDIKRTLLQNLGGEIGPGAEICLAFSTLVRDQILATTEFAALVKGGNGGNADRIPEISDPEMARIFRVDRVFHSIAQANGSDIWDDEFALLFVRRTGSLTSLRSNVQCCRTFMWAPDAGENIVVDRYRNEGKRSDMVRVRQHLDEKVITAAAGYLLANISE